ncbi:MAG: hypothetical protein PHX86_01445 [Caldisericia bacterium]|nr:hypothetical protein [Caldisericia bacterium]
MASQEYILSITTKKASHKMSTFSARSCHLIFTNLRIIVAYYDPDKALEAYKQQLTSYINNGSSSGVYMKVNLRFQSFSTFYHRYICMSPEEILKEHPDNFCIHGSDIRNLVFSKGSCCKDVDGFEDHTPDKLNITLKSKHRKSFYLKSCFFHELCGALHQIVPNAKYNGDKFLFYS